MSLSRKFAFLLAISLTAAVAATLFVLYEVRSEAERQATVAQEGRINTFWQLLRSKGDVFAVIDGKLMVGSYVANGNFELPDLVQKLFGGTATIFMGDTRVSTNVLKEDGSRAVGTRLTGKAYDAIFREGRSYRGETTILDIPYFTAYDPIKNAKGEVIGVLYVGTKRSEFFSAYDLLSRKLIAVALINVSIFTLLAVYLVRRSLRTLNRLTSAVRSVAEGDLDVQVPVESRDEIGVLAESFNTMTSVVFKGMQEEIAKTNRMVANIKETIQQLSTSANEIMAISAQQSAGATQQATAVQEAMTTAEEMAVTARQVAQNAVQVETQAERANAAGSHGGTAVANALSGMGELRSQMLAVAEAMLQLGENSQKIGGIVDIIDEISDQTNLLALNATIEAAGAGEAGKRFAVVANEVKRLSQRTAEATGQIKSLIEAIQKATNATIMLTENGTKGVDAANILVTRVAEALQEILQLIQETNAAAKEINFSTQQQTSASEEMASTIVEVRDVATQVASGAQETTQAIAELTGLAERLKDLMEDELQTKGKAKALAGARLMSRILHQALTSGALTEADLFDENYIPIPGTDPQKFTTRFDAYCDAHITAKQDDFLNDVQVAFAVLIDRHGYLPTHNSRYTQPLTGDYDRDLKGNRTKRMFDDKVGLAAARNEEELLVQVYNRDTGERIWDISAPVYINGRHWGGFRIGYTM
ncbi:MAG: hypothetical protein A2091_01320 [Desulfuromonadales bacterium GWD2_61_12]|nr:MAG: hypothetical protein A2005_04425 [Desulfuromonadales bacterium GWC2_61_20]OGR33940.1 MAG: hypothetical protein A2091_01320 [Desulfuromonadales bacterium GWD2_61_12]HAD05135.1 methyl-accepting chemotaxis protein [Desulfuromonas sp.]HBT82130.1 methyl-accepting chemotaxis protein [Desulfuromonas sp.]